MLAAWSGQLTQPLVCDDDDNGDGGDGADWHDNRVVDVIAGGGGSGAVVGSSGATGGSTTQTPQGEIFPDGVTVVVQRESMGPGPSPGPGAAGAKGVPSRPVNWGDRLNPPRSGDPPLTLTHYMSPPLPLLYTYIPPTPRITHIYTPLYPSTPLLPLQHIYNPPPSLSFRHTYTPFLPLSPPPPLRHCCCC